MQDPESIRKFRDGQALYQQERWEEALKVFDDLSLSYKTNQDIMLNRAMCLARIGKEEEAELICDYLTVAHQDPRGRQLKAEIPAWKREGKTAPPEEKTRKPLISPEMLKAGIIACFVIAVLLAGWTFYSNYEAPVPPPISTAPAPAERTLYFPDDVALGTVFARDWGFATDPQGDHKQSWQRIGPARGRVEIPAGKEVQLNINGAQLNHLRALRRFDANAIQSLIINNSPLQDADLAHVGHLTGLFEISIDNTPVGPDGYARLERLTSLRRISIIDTELGEAGRQFLARQSFLEHLDGDRAGLRDEWLIGLPPMNKLIFLSLDDTEGITDAGVKRIARHQNLEDLFLSYTGVTDEGIKALQSLKKLQRLWLEGTAITDACMDGFRLMPNIEEIGIAYTAVSTEGLMALRDIRTLKKVGAIGCDNISAEGIRQFKAFRPDCEVETNLNI